LDEIVSEFDTEQPNVLFLVDLSDDMGTACEDSDQTYLQATFEAIEVIVRYRDGARFGVVGTAEDADDNTFREVSPLGSDADAIARALGELETYADNSKNGNSKKGPTRNLAEALAGLSVTYFSLDQDSDDPSFDFAPILFAAQESHVITITAGLPQDDDDPMIRFARGSLADDVRCNPTGHESRGMDWRCQYDNATAALSALDHRDDLTGVQAVVVHTVGLGLSQDDTAWSLYENAAEQTSGSGLFENAPNCGALVGDLLQVLDHSTDSLNLTAAPLVHADGDIVLFAYSAEDEDDPLPQGHLRAYRVGADPSDIATYGKVIADPDAEFGGAIWDAGNNLADRSVSSGERNGGDLDGLGRRDIFTFVPELMDPALSSAVSEEAWASGRMSLDSTFVSSVADTRALLDLFLNTEHDENGDPVETAYDLDQDGQVDGLDMQVLVDFVRGVEGTPYRFLESEHSTWRLGESVQSVPVIVRARRTYTRDTSYTAFQRGLLQAGVPDIALHTSNDGMLHAFSLEDDETTQPSVYGDLDEAGQELWAWVPAYVLYRQVSDDWSDRLIEMPWFGSASLFDGSPTVEDVWIDSDGDGQKALDGSEWHRVVVVSQGVGGPAVLALDITDPRDPIFLWEMATAGNETAAARATSTPIIANLLDSTGDELRDIWTALWGSGRAVGSSGTAAYSEASLRSWAIRDTWWADPQFDYEDFGHAGTFDPLGSVVHPEFADLGSLLDLDGDGRPEFGEIPGGLTVVDVDNDGDADVVYVAVTALYETADLGDEDGDGITGTSDLVDPGSSWLYKAILDPSNPGEPTWCEVFDPQDDFFSRPEMHHAATAAWHADGSLGLYFGSGTPFAAEASDEEWLFALNDPSPTTCTAANPIASWGEQGGFRLDAGERMTTSPQVIAGVVYFTTWTGDLNGELVGEGRVYAFDYQDGSAVMDLDGDGLVDGYYLTIEGYPASMTLSDQGTLFYGYVTADGIETAALGEIVGVVSGFESTQSMALASQL
jgi:hypothetical protein